MARSPPNLHTMDSRSVCTQGVLKVKVKVKGHVIRALSWILGMSYSVIDGLVCFALPSYYTANKDFHSRMSRAQPLMHNIGLARNLSWRGHSSREDSWPLNGSCNPTKETQWLNHSWTMPKNQGSTMVLFGREPPKQGSGHRKIKIFGAIFG